jgi:transmembrane sensor
MKNNNQNINTELIARYLANETSFEENQQIDKWIEADYENEKLFKEYKRTWEELKTFKNKSIIDIDEEWNKISNVIDQKEKSQPKSRILVSNFTKIAAIFIFVILSGAGIAFLDNQIRFVTIKTSDLTHDILLPDGSEVTLNVHSKLKYLKKFKENKRQVFLNGEAFFDVATDSTKPFVISVSNAVIEVLGTSFNVNAYKENKNIEVVVSEGKVALSSTKLVTEKVILKKGDKGFLDKKKAKVKTVKNSNLNYVAWKTKKLVFENTRLIEVIEEINQVYHTNIVIRSPEIADCKITVTFNKKSIDAILTILKNTLDIEISKSDKTIILTGKGCSSE